MDNVPLNIKLVRVYAKNKHIIKILQEYYNGLPHIKFTNCGLGYAYFAFPSTKAIGYVLQNIRHYLNRIHCVDLVRIHMNALLHYTIFIISLLVHGMLMNYLLM